ncbi:ran-binding protein 9-like [Oppia nitens]|uniref:ran-binding protein 9-like n=1 Tax=Oppia nitens TaxID=1686743 RepID=UPI0023DB02C3|nr:ran-binding protein 9-like [Oppia nitens]
MTSSSSQSPIGGQMDQSGDSNRSYDPNTRSNSMSPIPATSSTPLNVSEGLSRLQQLYPYVDESELPKSWSAKDKANFITLSENNLKVHYKGVGKGHKDAAAVRATHSIPSGCLLYYYEIKIISKGRDGYMGIGLAAQGVNMQRLPGWDKQSYGYHGDDGHSFNSSGTGQPYGPTFTTGDIIGCGYNLILGNCFYTKNGLNLGVAFSDLPNVPLYPTVGLQTPGEEVEANFGMQPFCYDIEEDIIALKKHLTESIVEFPVKYTEWQTTIHRLVQSWLIHNGYCSTAEVFSKTTKLDFKENVQHIKQRLKIQQLVLNGHIGEAISLTNKLYPNVLKDNPNLLFALKCRQFVEWISGNESDKAPIGAAAAMTASYSPNNSTNGVNDCNGNSSEQMEVDVNDNNTNDTNNTYSEEQSVSEETEAKFTRLLAFGKELNALSQQLKRQFGTNEFNRQLLQDTFSLLAYSDPWSSPVGWHLNPSEREGVCQQLNNAIVMSDSGGATHRVALETIIKHTKALLPKNGQCGAWLVDKI